MARWYAGVDEDELRLSTIVLGEIRKGIERVREAQPAYADQLETWLADVQTAFGPRILPVDLRVADAWGRLSSRRTVPVIDCLLAATARVHGLVLVTRNTAHVRDLGVDLLDPFQAA